jgi:hypothetical protein
VVYFTVSPANNTTITIANADFANLVTSQNATNSVSGNVLLNDNNTAGANLTASLVSGPSASQGGFTLNADGSYTFIPTVGFSGPVVIIYKACDGSTPPVCATNTLEILVSPAPIINNNSITLDYGVTNLSVPLNGNLNTNDNIVPGSKYGQPSNNPNNPSGAKILVNESGTYTFSATSPGTYTYYVPVCGVGQTTGCPLSLLMITVVDPLSKNNPPIANPDLAITFSNTPVTTNVLANDKSANTGISLNPASLSIVNSPKNGNVIINSDGTITYTPSANFIGTDSLIYNICDNTAPNPICKNALVFYTIKPSSNIPETIATDDFVSIITGATISGNVLNNDKNTGGATLAVSNVTSVPANKGVFLMNTNGSFTFTPAPGFTGPIEISYTVCGGSPSTCSNATLHILVEPLIIPKILEVTKSANSAVLNLDATYDISFVIKTQNLTKEFIDSVLIKDDLTKVFSDTRGIKVVSVITSGGLVRNANYDGISNVDLVTLASSLEANKTDSVILRINISNNTSGNFANTAFSTAPTSYGLINVASTDPTKMTITDTTRKPTEFIIPLVDVKIPEGFSPNNDGTDDTWIITRPFGSSISVILFNRWGNEVYHNSDYKNDWRGKGINNILG